MKKFEYKLETLLKLRLMKEKMTKFELGKILSEIHSVKESIELMKEEIKESYEAYDAFMATGGGGGDMLKFFPEFVKVKKNHIEMKENYLFGLDKKYKIKAEELSLKQADVKIMEKLKEKDKASYTKLKMKKEREELEEFVANSHYKKNRDHNEQI